jgi:hypothetical protein
MNTPFPCNRCKHLDIQTEDLVSDLFDKGFCKKEGRLWGNCDCPKFERSMLISRLLLDNYKSTPEETRDEQWIPIKDWFNLKDRMSTDETNSTPSGAIIKHLFSLEDRMPTVGEMTKPELDEMGDVY